MEQHSPLQQQFPLSTKKFWKKMIENGLSIVILDFILGGALCGMGYLVLTSFSIIPLNLSLILVASTIFAILLALVVTHLGLYAWYVKTYIARYYYAGEDNFITIKKGVFAPTEIHVQWQKIQDVYVDQDILDRFMGLYDVHIASATASSGIEAHIDGVDKSEAEGLKHFLLNKMSGKMKAGDSTMASTGTDTQSAQATAAPTIDLTEDISSTTYPLSGTWSLLAIFNRIVGAMITAFVLALIAFLKTKNVTQDDIALFILGGFALGVVISLWNIAAFFIWKKNYAFKFTPEHIYYRTGIFSLTEKHMPYSSIQDVTVKQGIIDRVFGFAKVVIENAAQQQMIVGKYGKQEPVSFAGIILEGLSLADANKVTNLLKNSVLGKNTSRNGL